ncbi:MAG: DNA polymerase III subunit chi [Pseudomonadota bacterium]
MSELGFYHLTQAPLEKVLPVMLTRAWERGWRSEVRGRDPARLDALDHVLWTFSQEIFLPHGQAGQPHADRQPVLLTTAPAPEGGPREALFLVDGAALDPAEAGARTRTALLFDGHDEAAVETARTEWRAATAAGLKAVYWAQGEKGGWEKKAESG